MAGDEKISIVKKPAFIFRRDSKAYFMVASLFLAGVFLFFYYQGNAKDRLHYYYMTTMGTSVEVRFSGVDKKTADRLKDEIFNEINRLEALFSRTLATSEISTVNRYAGLKPVHVTDEIIYVTVQAVYYARLSEGAFDPTIAPLIDLWGFLGQDYRRPATEELEKTLLLVDYALLEIDRERSELFLPAEGMALELGGIAKGYIVDRVLEILKAAGVEHAFINAGGDIGLIGSKPDGSPWIIGVGNPREENKIIVVLPAVGTAIVTSGDYQRFFIENDTAYHHILDPESGMPAGELASVTIMASTVIEADALSTAVFVLGPVKGMALIEKLPGVEGILIDPELEIFLSDGLKEIVEIHP